MSLLNTQDKALQAAALRAGFRTFEQTLSAGIGVGTIGGVALGWSLDKSGAINFSFTWQALLTAVLFLLASSLLAGLRAYLSMASSGLPPQYVEAAKKAIADAGSSPTLEDATMRAAQDVLAAVAVQQATRPTGIPPQQL
jgi:hypothetical protein